MFNVAVALEPMLFGEGNSACLGEGKRRDVY